MKEHPKNRVYVFTMLRTDGTQWVKNGIKHLITKPGFVVLYEGEHGRDRRETWIPVERIDHFTLEESEA